MKRPKEEHPGARSGFPEFLEGDLEVLFYKEAYAHIRLDSFWCDRRHEGLLVP